MARTDPPTDDATTSTELAPDALSLLTRDHRLVEELFTELERSTPQQLDPLARRICKLLRVHTQIEEELFYPAAGRALPNESFIERAEHEHAEARETIARVESLAAAHPDFNGAIALLAQQISEHVQEEEGQLFPQLRKGSLNLIALGLALAERRDTLLDVLGLHDDDEEGIANQHNTHPSPPAQQDERRS
jgi:hemerythrin superfamily protein